MKKPRVLVVDDEPKIVELIRVNIGQEYDVDVAYDGEEAIEKAINPSGPRPDLIILDVMLPKVNGFDVARKVKENRNGSTILIAMFTGRDKSDMCMVGSVGCDADYFLSKPIDLNELSELLAKIFPSSAAGGSASVR